MASPRPVVVLCITLVAILALLFLNASLPNRPDQKLPDQDIEGVSQDHPDLIRYIRSLLIVQPPLNGKFYDLKNPEINDTSQHGQTKAVAKLFKNKLFGTFFEAGAYDGEDISNTLFLERHLNWTGLLVEPDPWNFWSLKKKKRRAHILHGCVSPTKHMREVSFRQSDTMGHIVDSSEKGGKGIFTRVRCFPLFSLLLAQNLTKLDFLSLDVEGDELKILETVPWDEVDVTTLLIESTHVPEGADTLKKFLQSKNYNLHSTIGNDLLFVKSQNQQHLDLL